MIGINYTGTCSQLNGCINDTINIKKVIEEKFKYSNKNITMLNDLTDKKPTINNIWGELNKMLEKINKKECNEFWFHYSTVSAPSCRILHHYFFLISI